MSFPMRKRPLEPSEMRVACPRCGSLAGKHCTLAWCNEPGISAVAHVERKRAAGRAWRVKQIVNVLCEYHLSDRISNKQLAELIDDALHDRKEKS